MPPKSDSASDSASNPTDPEVSNPGGGGGAVERPAELKLVSAPQFEEVPNLGPASGPSKAPHAPHAPHASEEEGACVAPGPSELEQGPPGAAAEPGHDSGASERRRPPIWLCVVVIVASAIALGWQFRVAGQLKQEIGGLQQELRETQVLLGAHKSRLAEIRGGVHDLATQLEGLRVLVDADPNEPASVVALPVDNPGASIPARLPAE